MKKVLAMILMLCLALSVTACGGDTADNADIPTPPAAENTDAGSDTSAEPVVPADGFVFTYNGIEIALHANAAPIIEALGEPKSYTESASCAFEGLDKTYYYGSFYVDTYPVGEEDFVFGVWFADDSVATQEGVYIGASKAEVEAAYGEENFNGSNAYIVTKGDCTLTIILEDDVVTSVQYSVVVE